MKKILSVFLLIGFGFGDVMAQTPEKIYSIAKVDKPHEYFVQQAELWWKVIESDKKNEDAWYNYYKANRYSLRTYKGLNGVDGHRNDGWDKESQYLKPLDDILKLIEKNIPDSYTDLRLRKTGLHNDPEMFKSLEKAYQMRPNEADIYDSFVVYYEMNGNAAKRKEFNEKLFASNEISSGFLNYSYNVLMTLKPNSIILTFGDNDTFPLWLLQDVLNIRTDVIVLNVPLLSEPVYQSVMFEKIGIKSNAKTYKDGATSESEKEILDYILKNNKLDLHPLYIGLPAWKQLKDYETNLFIVGLALEYSKGNVDNIAMLRNNFENKYALDYLSHRFEYDRSASLVDRANINYLPGIFKLYEHYSTCGDVNSATRMRKLGLQIAQKGGQEWIDKANAVLK